MVEASGPVLIESGGVVVAEAEDHFTGRTTIGGREWRIVPDEDPGDVAHANARGGAYLQVLPDSGGAFTASPPIGTSPAVQYTLRIATADGKVIEAAMDDKPVGSTAIVEAIEVRKKNPLHEYRVILRPGG